MTARPIVSADRRYVQVSLNVELNDPGATGNQPAPQPKTMTIENTVSVPDGGTVLLGGLKRLTETRTETSPPVLGKVPYVNRLFKNVGYGRESQSVLVMVTPAHSSSPARKKRRRRASAPSPGEGCPADDEPSGEGGRGTAQGLPGGLRRGPHAEARKYARAVLAIDPTCFRK